MQEVSDGSLQERCSSLSHCPPPRLKDLQGLWLPLALQSRAALSCVTLILCGIPHLSPLHQIVENQLQSLMSLTSVFVLRGRKRTEGKKEQTKNHSNFICCLHNSENRFLATSPPSCDHATTLWQQKQFPMWKTNIKNSEYF